MNNSISEDRRKLFDSAVSFLGDASVKDAPLTKKIEFLEQKGLNQDEIETALKISRESKSNTGGNNEGKLQGRMDSNGPTYDYMYESLPPPIPQRDWKDYFIMATATAGLFYGLYEVTRRYVVPNILPETKTKLEQDKDEIQTQFDKVDKLLNTIEQEQKEFRDKESAKLEELDITIADLQNTLNETTRTRETMENDFKMLKLELSNLQNSVDKFVSSNGTIYELNQITNEISSLKNLIKNSTSFKQTPELSENNKNDINNNKNNTSIQDNPKLKAPIPGIPGVEAIPSASELLAKMNFSTETEITPSDNVPAWKKAREETRSKSNVANDSESTNENLPAWQVAMEAAQSDDNQ